MSFPYSLIPHSRLSVFRPRRNIEAEALLLYIYTYIYNNKLVTTFFLLMLPELFSFVGKVKNGNEGMRE